MNTAATQVVSSFDRFGFTLFFATALHALAIIGVGFESEDIPPPKKTIEVTLAQYQQEKPPEQADFIAQANQQGSGQSEEKHRPATTQKAEFQDQQIQELAGQLSPLPPAPVQPQVAQAKPSKPAEEKKPQPKPKSSSEVKKKVITTTEVKKKQVAKKASKPEKTAAAPPAGTATSLLARSLEIASLEAQIERHREEMARKPRIRRLTSASTQKRSDAIYLENWRKKIENIGNLNYPEEARRNKLYGSLRLMVAIKADGSVKSIEILESSGHPILDDAAIRIVRLAAPFQPFTVEMRKNTDVLEIIRTWKFEKKAYIY